jgi:hypothetical protein
LKIIFFWFDKDSAPDGAGKFLSLGFTNAALSGTDLDICNTFDSSAGGSAWVEIGDGSHA